MGHYRRLTLMEREELSRMLAAGYSLRVTAQVLQRAPSTLSRELTRHRASPVTYRAVAAHQRAHRWAHHPRKLRKLVSHPRLRSAVLQLLAQRWSPEQIAHGLPQRYPEDPTMRISHEAIYTYLYVLPCGGLKRELARYLRRRHRFRRPHKVRLSSRPIQDLISIDERPQEVAARTVPGHWEGDLLVGHANASALGTLVERTTRFTLLVPLKAKDAATVRQAFARELRTLPRQLRRSPSPTTKGLKCGSIGSSPSRPRCGSILRTPILPGSEGRTRTPMGCSASSFPRGRGSRRCPTRKSNGCRHCSTIGPERF